MGIPDFDAISEKFFSAQATLGVSRWEAKCYERLKELLQGLHLEWTCPPDELELVGGEKVDVRPFILQAERLCEASGIEADDYRLAMMAKALHQDFKNDREYDKEAEEYEDLPEKEDKVLTKNYPDSDPRPKWEYNVVLMSEVDIAQVARRLDEFGAKSWELVSAAVTVQGVFRYFLKRRVR